MLQADDSLPVSPQRILIAGVTGVGKTTLVARISVITGIPHTEIDALHHGCGWSKRDSFVDDVTAFSGETRWVSEWQYREVRGLLADRADTLVWLDLPRRVALPRLLLRTIRRRILREELWNANVEPPLHTFFTNPSDNIIR